MRVDPLELALSPDLVDLVDTNGGDLLDRVRALPPQMALELGMVMPPVRTRDDLDLPLSSYAIRISGVDAGAARRHRDRAGDRRRTPGPARPGRRRTGLRPAGKWVPPELHYQPSWPARPWWTGLGDHHAPGRDRPYQRQPPARPRGRPGADRDGQAHPSGGGRGAHPAQLSLGQIQKVLHGLLDEGVPIRTWSGFSRRCRCEPRCRWTTTA